MLHPDARALLDLIAERDLPAMHTLTPVDARAFYRDRRAFTQPPAPEVGAVVDTGCDGPHGTIPLKWSRSGSTFNATPWKLTHRRTRTPMAAILSSLCG